LLFGGLVCVGGPHLTDAIRLRPGHTGGNEHEPLLWVLALMFGVLSAVPLVRVWGLSARPGSRRLVRRRWLFLLSVLLWWWVFFGERCGVVFDEGRHRPVV
jgi:hypothetical protein